MKTLTIKTRRPLRTLALTLVVGFGLVASGHAQEKRFLDLVGPGTVGPVTQTAPLQVPLHHLGRRHGDVLRQRRA